MKSNGLQKEQNDVILLKNKILQAKVKELELTNATLTNVIKRQSYKIRQIVKELKAWKNKVPKEAEGSAGRKEI